MHVLNRLFDKGAGTYNDPRGRLLQEYRRFYPGQACLLQGALAVFGSVEPPCLLATAGLSILGTVYSLPHCGL